jgi:hypothetical protein
MSTPAPIPIALTIAGSDSSGGAGIQADLKTFSAFGVYGASVLTALTAQNTRGVQAVEAVQPQFVAQQLRSVLSDLDVRAAKTGMLATAGIIDVVACELAAHGTLALVVDPVMVATSGDVLLAPDAVSVLKSRLLPLALVVTPNIPEAAALVGATPARTEIDRTGKGDRGNGQSGGPGQRRSRPGRGGGRYPLRRRHCHTTGGCAYCHAAYTRNGLHAVVCHRRLVGAGRRPRAGRAPCQGLHLGSAGERAHPWCRSGPRAR